MSEWVTRGLWLLVLLLTVRFAFFLSEAAARPSAGFITYYAASRLLDEGYAVNQFYDDEWFSGHTRRFLSQVSDIYRPHPPTTAYLFWPLHLLSYSQARLSWVIFSLLCLAMVLILLLREADWHDWHMPAFLIFVLLYQPLYANFWVAQAYVVLLLLLLMAYVAYRQRKEAWLGITLAVMLIFKLSMPFVWLLLLVQRRWQALAWGMGTLFLTVAATLPWLSLAAWRTFAQVISQYGSKPWFAATAYQTQHSLWHHLFVYDRQWSPQPWFDAPLLADGLTWLGLVILLGTALYVGYRLGNHEVSFGLMVVTAVIITPVSQSTHYVLLLLPIFLMAKELWQRPFSWLVLLFLLSVMAIALDLPYRSPDLQGGWRAILAYPNLYGAFMLWAIYLFWFWRLSGHLLVSPEA